MCKIYPVISLDFLPCVSSNREDPLISCSLLGNSSQRKEKQVKREMGNASPTANPSPKQPAGPQKMEEEVVLKASLHILNRTHPALLPTIALQGASTFLNPPGSTPQTPLWPSGSSVTHMPTKEAAPPTTATQQKVKWMSQSSRRHLCFTSRVGRLCLCSSKTSLTRWRSSTTTAGSTSAGAQNLEGRLWSEPPPSHGWGCPATQDWRLQRWTHRAGRQMPVSASPPAPPKLWGTTSPLTRAVTLRAASRWRWLWRRVAGSGWRDAAIPRQKQTLTSFCLLKSPTSDSAGNLRYN